MALFLNSPFYSFFSPRVGKRILATYLHLELLEIEHSFILLNPFVTDFVTSYHRCSLLVPPPARRRLQRLAFNVILKMAEVVGWGLYERNFRGVF